MAGPSGYYRINGISILAGVALAAVVVAAFNAFNEGNGIAYSGGAYLVLVSSLLLLFAALVLATVTAMPRWLRAILITLVLLDIAGTGLAGYFLETFGLVALMGIGLIAWFVLLSTDRAGDSNLRQRGVNPS
jgi:glucan phosphoethanolaminetransferase (alkaline phosphatase superfamily)